MSCPGHRRRFSGLAVGFLAFGLLAIPSTSSGQTSRELDPEHQEWLERVALLILPEEREYFLSIDEPFRRDAFIEAFWRVRDPDTQTARNEFRRSWDERVDLALEAYGSVTDVRAVLLLFNGEPGRFRLPDGRIVTRCFRPRQKVEVWFYGGSLRTDKAFVAILYAPDFPPEAEHRIWLNREVMKPAQRWRLPVTNPSLFCDDNTWGWAMRTITDMGWDVYRNLIEDLIAVPKPDSEEWIATFNARSTLLPDGAATLEAQVDFDFPGRNQNRVAVRGVVSLPAAKLSARRIKGQAAHEVLVTGEVVREDRLFEQFRYRYEVPVDAQTARVPIIFQRYLRPGPYRVLLKVEDLLGRRFALFDEGVEVPEPEDLESIRSVLASELAQQLEEARQAAARGQTTISIVSPPPRDIMVGPLRVNTISAGEFDKVTFYLDGKPLLSKKRPPFSVELNLGAVAESHRLRVVAFGPEGDEVASDEMLINQGGQRFRVRLIEPRSDRTYETSLSAVVQAEVPDGKKLDRIEVFLDEQRLATLYQPPFEHVVLLERQELAYVRAVGFLADGSSAEDVVFINAPDYFDQLEVQFVELYATVIGKHGGQRLDLGRKDFTVFEDGGERQEIRRFDYVRDLRSQYLISYQSTSGKDPAQLRLVRVEVDERGAEVRTLSGYYP